jgi:hypothetical protein
MGMFARRRVAGVLGGLTLLMSGAALAQEEEEATPAEAVPAEATAREARTRRHRPFASGAGYFLAGARWLDTGALLDALGTAARPYERAPGAGDPFVLLGWGGHHLKGRWLLGGEGYGLHRRREVARSGDFLVGVNGGYGLFRLGFALVNTPRLSVYALGGIGGGAVSVSIHQRRDVSFGDVIENPARQVTLARGGLLLDAGLGADYRLLLAGGRPHHQPFIHLGLRAGWLFMPLAGSWRSMGGTVTDGPSFGLGGPGATPSVGFGGLVRRWKH